MKLDCLLLGSTHASSLCSHPIIDKEPSKPVAGANGDGRVGVYVLYDS